jgi:hypothetical protein
MILTPHVTQMAQILGHNCVRLLLCAYGQHMNVLQHSIYDQYECRKQFKVAVSRHHDVMS